MLASNGTSPAKIPPIGPEHFLSFFFLSLDSISVDDDATDVGPRLSYPNRILSVNALIDTDYT